MQVFYDPNSMQVMAVAKGCRDSGEAWKASGFVEAEAPDSMPLSRDLKVTVENGIVSAWKASPNPAQPAAPKPKEITALAFMDRFTPDERAAIRAAARNSDALADWIDRFRAARTIGLEDARTIAGLDAVVSAGLLTAERKAAILTP